MPIPLVIARDVNGLPMTPLIKRSKPGNSSLDYGTWLTIKSGSSMVHSCCPCVQVYVSWHRQIFIWGLLSQEPQSRCVYYLIFFACACVFMYIINLFSFFFLHTCMFVRACTCARVRVHMCLYIISIISWSIIIDNMAKMVEILPLAKMVDILLLNLKVQVQTTFPHSKTY